MAKENTAEQFDEMGELLGCDGTMKEKWDYGVCVCVETVWVNGCVNACVPGCVGGWVSE